MRWRGLEPPRPVRATRPSTLRVYQFRHQRGTTDSSEFDVVRTSSVLWRTYVLRRRDADAHRPTARDLRVHHRVRRRARLPADRREIGDAVGLASPSTVHAHLANLERAGYLRRDPTKPRALELVGRERPSRGDRTRGEAERVRVSRWSARSPPAGRSSPSRTSRTHRRARAALVRAGRGVPPARPRRQHDRGRDPRGRLRGRPAAERHATATSSSPSPVTTSRPTRPLSSGSSASRVACGSSPRTAPRAALPRARPGARQGRRRLQEGVTEWRGSAQPGRSSRSSSP